MTRLPEAHIFTDASGRWGCGAYWNTQWFKAPWSSTWQQVNIVTKELVPVILALAVWGEQLASLHVQIYSDNMAVVEVIRAKSSKDCTVMHLLRCMHFFAAKHDIMVSAVHIPGVDNSRANALSRDHTRSSTSSNTNPSAAVVPGRRGEKVDWFSQTWSSRLKSL